MPVEDGRERRWEMWEEGEEEDDVFCQQLRHAEGERESFQWRSGAIVWVGI